MNYQNTPQNPAIQPPAPPPQVSTMAQLTVQSAPQIAAPIVSLPDIVAATTAAPQITNATRPNPTQSPQIPVNIINRDQPLLSMTSTAPSTVTTMPQQIMVTSASQQQPIQQPPQNVHIAKQTQHQIIQENEQFANAWVKANFEPCQNEAKKLEQREVYNMYLNSSAKIGRKGVLAATHFPKIVRTVYGNTVGPNQVKVIENGVETIQHFYDGIKLRAKPLTIVQKTTTVVSLSVSVCLWVLFF